MVTVRNVEKRFGPVHAVRGVSFTLHTGQVVGLLGHNGAGKSTTMRMIAGYLAPDAGQVTIAGHDTTLDRRHAARHVGYMPESTPLYPEMRRASTCTTGASSSGWDGEPGASASQNWSSAAGSRTWPNARSRD